MDNNTTIENINSAASNMDALLAEMLSMVQGTKGFVMEQAPELIQQILVLEITNNCVGIFICLCLIAAYGFFVAYEIKCWKNNKEVFDLDNEEASFLSFSFFFIGLVPLIIILFKIYSLIKVLIAPKVFLIDYLSNLIG